jgi:hypothetical protein
MAPRPGEGAELSYNFVFSGSFLKQIPVTRLHESRFIVREKNTAMVQGNGDYDYMEQWTDAEMTHQAQYQVSGRKGHDLLDYCVRGNPQVRLLCRKGSHHFQATNHFL